jgi:hypothetical protein
MKICKKITYILTISITFTNLLQLNAQGKTTTTQKKKLTDKDIAAIIAATLSVPLLALLGAYIYKISNPKNSPDQKLDALNDVSQKFDSLLAELKLTLQERGLTQRLSATIADKANYKKELIDFNSTVLELSKVNPTENQIKELAQKINELSEKSNVSKKDWYDTLVNSASPESSFSKPEIQEQLKSSFLDEFNIIDVPTTPDIPEVPEIARDIKPIDKAPESTPQLPESEESATGEDVSSDWGEGILG